MITSYALIGKYGNVFEKEIQLKYEANEMGLWLVDYDIKSAIPVLPGRIYCNKKMIPMLQKAFRALIAKQLHTEIRTYDGCFNVRRKRGSSAVSLHAYGLAIDLNAAWNRFGGTVTFSNAFLQVWRDNGFDCGADWKKKDGMHFQPKVIPT